MSTYRLSTENLPRTEFDIPRLEFTRPIQWLRLGWGDLRATPAMSLAYGLLVALPAMLFVYLTLGVDRFYLVPFLFGGFMFITPLLSIGLMAIAKHHEEQGTHDNSAILRILSANRSSIALMGIFLVLIFINWIMLSNLMFGSIFQTLLPTYAQVRPLPLMFSEGLSFLAVFGGIALLLAIIVFRITALSLPMLVDQRVDAFNAAFASWRAVGENWQSMTLWAIIIAGLCALGLVTAFAGLVIVIPWLGYASWHAYRDTLIRLGKT